jgi:hypothetical protein
MCNAPKITSRFLEDRKTGNIRLSIGKPTFHHLERFSQGLGRLMPNLNCSQFLWIEAAAGSADQHSSTVRLDPGGQQSQWSDCDTFPYRRSSSKSAATRISHSLRAKCGELSERETRSRHDRTDWTKRSTCQSSKRSIRRNLD